MAAYSASVYHIQILNNGQLKVLTRSSSSVVDSYDLNSIRVKISKDDDDFVIAGTDDWEDVYSQVDLKGNSVDITTGFILENIGAGSEEIDIAQKKAIIKLDNTVLKFDREAY